MIQFKHATLGFFKEIRTKYGDRRDIKWIGRNITENFEVIFYFEPESRKVDITRNDQIIEEFDIDDAPHIERILKDYEVAYIEKKENSKQTQVKETEQVKIAS